VEQSWRGDFNCCFMTSKIEENQRLGTFLNLQSDVIYTVGNMH